MTSHGESAPPDKRGARLDRDDYRCKLCNGLSKEKGGDADLEVHHRVPVEEGGDHSLDNLITVCKQCHAWFHAFDEISAAGLDFSDVSYEPSNTDIPLLMMLGQMAPASVGDLADAIGAEQSVVVQRLYKLTSIGVVAPTDSVLGSSKGKWDFHAHVDEPAIGELPDNPEDAARLTRDEIMRQLHESGASQVSIAEELGVSRRTVIRGISRARALKPPIPSVSDPKPAVETDGEITADD